ncbi:hypothetical protein BC940DRAFT_300030 [Gongronella butleri]|nr:hypothetical protein BC940DRAFT_300030 [Gongronella butleri]
MQKRDNLRRSQAEGVAFSLFHALAHEPWPRFLVLFIFLRRALAQHPQQLVFCRFYFSFCFVFRPSPWQQQAIGGIGRGVE